MVRWWERGRGRRGRTNDFTIVSYELGDGHARLDVLGTKEDTVYIELE